MPFSKIKTEFFNKRIAFGKKSDLPLGERQDIDDLAVIAIESQDRSLLRLFEKLPDLTQLKKQKTDEALKQAELQRQIAENKKKDAPVTKRPSVAKAMAATKTKP